MRRSYRRENFSLRKSETVLLLLPSRLDRRGVRVVTDVAAGCGGRERVARRARRERTAKSCGPDLPTLGSSLSGDEPVRRWRLSSPALQGEHEAAVNTI